jgi:hypothetical protein
MYVPEYILKWIFLLLLTFFTSFQISRVSRVSYGFWVYNYPCNQWLLPLKLWVRTPFLAKWTMNVFTLDGYGTVELWCLTPLSTILQLYRCGQLYWGRKQEYPEKTANLPHRIIFASQGLRVGSPFSPNRNPWLAKMLQIRTISEVFLQC